MAEFLEDDFSA